MFPFKYFIVYYYKYETLFCKHIEHNDNDMQYQLNWTSICITWPTLSEIPVGQERNIHSSREEYFITKNVLIWL